MAGVDLGGNRGKSKKNVKLTGTTNQRPRATGSKVGSTTNQRPRITNGGKTSGTSGQVGGGSKEKSSKSKPQSNADKNRARALKGPTAARNQIQGRERDKYFAGRAQMEQDALESPEEMQMGLMDYLNQALGMMGGGEQGGGASAEPSIDYGSLRSALQGRASSAEERIAQSYKQLGDKYAAAGPEIAGQYGAASGAINASHDQAVQGIQNAADASNNMQTGMLKALGIEDAASNLLAMGGNAQRDTQLARQNVEQNRAANVGQVTNNGAAAQTFNTQMGQAAQMSGAEERSSLQQQLSSRMADLDISEQKDRASMASSQSESQGANYAQALSMAKALMDEQQFNTSRNDELEMQAAKMSQDDARYMDKVTADQRNQTAEAVQKQTTMSQISKMITGMGLKPSDRNYASVMSALIRGYS